MQKPERFRRGPLGTSNNWRPRNHTVAENSSPRTGARLIAIGVASVSNRSFRAIVSQPVGDRIHERREI